MEATLSMEEPQAEPQENKQPPKKKTVTLVLLKTVGTYADDAFGNPWATFDIVGKRSVVCAECGETITRGWARGKLGEEDFFCREHVSYAESFPLTPEEVQRQTEQQAVEEHLKAWAYWYTQLRKMNRKAIPFATPEAEDAAGEAAWAAWEEAFHWLEAHSIDEENILYDEATESCTLAPPPGISLTE